MLRRRDFMLLWSAQVISTTGNVVLLAGLPFYVYRVSGSALATGTMFLAQTLPRVLFGSLFATLVERWPLRTTLIASDLARATLLLLLLLVHSSDLLWLVYAVAAGEMLLSLFFDPARGALTPRLVHLEDLQSANALDALTTGLTTMVGPALGGLLLGLLGLPAIVILDAASYTLSALLIACIRQTTGQLEAPENEKPTRSALWRAWLGGIRIVSQTPTLGAVFLATAIAMSAQGIVTVILILYVASVLHAEVAAYGWLLTANGLGTLLGSFLAGWLGRRVPLFLLLSCGLLAVGGCVVMLALFPLLPLALILLALAGVAAMSYVVSAQTLLQRETPPVYLARVSGSYYNMVSLLMLPGMALASLLGGPLSARPLLLLAGLLFLLAGTLGRKPQRETHAG